MSERSSQRSVALTFIAGPVAAVLLVVLGFIQWNTALWESRVRMQAELSSHRARAVSEFLANVQDIETGQRGYLVTNKPEFRRPFDVGMQRLSAREAAVRRAYPGDDPSSKLAGELLQVGTARARRAAATVAVTATGDTKRAQELVLEGTGTRLMQETRDLARQLERNEERASQRLLQSNLQERADRLKLIYLIELLALLSLGLLLIGFIRLVRGLRASSRTLSDAATRQAAIFESASDAMLMLDERGCIENMNAAGERLFGTHRDEVRGKSNLSLFKDPPSEEVSQAYLRRLAQGDVKDGRQIFEGLRGDGSTLEAEVVTTPIHLEDGLHFLAIARDATERRQVERMKDEFVATVSHELRTPLTSIAGSLGLLLGGAAGALTDKAQRLVQIAHSNCERLIRLINEMLDIEKIESGKIVLNIQPIELAGAIEQTISAMNGMADRTSVRVEAKPLAEHYQVLADQDRLAQVLTNLVSNAIKFSPEGGTVEVFAESQGNGRVRISVTDHGPGIGADFRDKVFQKFAQADSTDSRQKGGTGLGLSIVKELVAKMGGSVGFTSEPGQGATFFFDLPAPQLSPEKLPAGEPMGRMEENGLPEVLHIDDDPDTLRLVASALEGRALVHSSPSIQEAKAAVERYDFDAVILDLALPDGSGYEIIELLTLEKAEQDIPVIVYTALDQEIMGEPEAFARLTKSKVTLDELVETVQRALERG